MLLLLTASVFLGSAILQSIAGFGFSLFAIAALLMLDYPLPEAVVLSTFGSTIQRCIGVATLHRSADWRTLSPLILIGIFCSRSGSGYCNLFPFKKNHLLSKFLEYSF